MKMSQLRRSPQASRFIHELRKRGRKVKNFPGSHVERFFDPAGIKRRGGEPKLIRKGLTARNSQK